MKFSEVIEKLLNEGYDKKDIIHWQQNIVEADYVDYTIEEVIEEFKDFLSQ